MPNGAQWIEFESQMGRMRVSEEYVVLEDHWIPEVLELVVGGEGDTEAYARVEVSESGSRLVELRFTSDDPDGQGIRQADLRGVQVSALTEALVAGFTDRPQRGGDRMPFERGRSGAQLHAQPGNVERAALARWTGCAGRYACVRRIHNPALLRFSVGEIGRMGRG